MEVWVSGLGLTLNPSSETGFVGVHFGLGGGRRSGP